ncbi:LysR family transcriptional regulator [Oecophyllibacter saccharovorans]|uniref:LysR substrate-binding domain-containing protein n=1 Tax=Oecophyllibacter saccharovorans TaxID=2558360 RepID=UPI001143CC2B|nr:LysR substrate-binding domain-containing protein [Oecophyllibacter saccharovorans]QDH15248.1 LysR family transcriptional regulator [Oecophyllibacter saccharovorans]
MSSYVPLSGLSLRDIEYVVAVDDLRNFSRAAERCGVSQAGLSEQVRKLEQLLGVSLFERSRRHVALTADGEKLLGLCREVLASARNLLEVARAHTGPLDGLLRIGVIPTLGPYYLPELLPQLRKVYPHLGLRLSEMTTPVLCKSLREGTLDLALMASLPLPDTLVEEPIFEEPFLAVFPSTHPLARRTRLRLNELAREDLLLLEDGHCLRDQALSLCATQRSHDERLATSLEMLWHMIAAEEGFSLVPQLALRNRTELETLVHVQPLVEKEARRVISLVWRQCDPRGPAFRELAAFLRTVVPEGCRALKAGEKIVRPRKRPAPSAAKAALTQTAGP